MIKNHNIIIKYMEYLQYDLKYYNNIHNIWKNVQILMNNLRDLPKKTCYLRKSVGSEENAFHSIEGRAFYLF